MAKLALGFLSAIQPISGWPSQPYILLWVCELSQWSDPNNKPSTVCYSWFTTPRGCWWNILSRPETRASGSAVGFLGFTGQVTATVTRIAKPSPESHCFRRQSQIHSTHIRAHLNLSPPRWLGHKKWCVFQEAKLKGGPGGFSKTGKAQPEVVISQWPRKLTQRWNSVIYLWKTTLFHGCILCQIPRNASSRNDFFIGQLPATLISAQRRLHWNTDDTITTWQLSKTKQTRFLMWKNPAKNHNHGKGHHHHQPLYNRHHHQPWKIINNHHYHHHHLKIP